MKLFIALLFLSQSPSFAEGFKCGAYCVDFNIEWMEVTAGAKTAKEAHDFLKKKCRNPTYGAGYLVDELGYWNLRSSRPSVACSSDPDVLDGELPYIGNLEVL